MNLITALELERLKELYTVQLAEAQHELGNSGVTSDLTDEDRKNLDPELEITISRTLGRITQIGIDGYI